MTTLNDRYSTLKAIRERDPLRTVRASKVAPFTVGEQDTTTKKKKPRRKARKSTQDSRRERNTDEDGPPLADPYERFHIPKTRCATHDIPVWVGENEGDPAFNVSL